MGGPLAREDPPHRGRWPHPDGHRLHAGAWKPASACSSRPAGQRLAGRPQPQGAPARARVGGRRRLGVDAEPNRRVWMHDSCSSSRRMPWAGLVPIALAVLAAWWMAGRWEPTAGFLQRATREIARGRRISKRCNRQAPSRLRNDGTDINTAAGTGAAGGPCAAAGSPRFRTSRAHRCRCCAAASWITIEDGAPTHASRAGQPARRGAATQPPGGRPAYAFGGRPAACPATSRMATPMPCSGVWPSALRRRRPSVACAWNCRPKRRHRLPSAGTWGASTNCCPTC